MFVKKDVCAEVDAWLTATLAIPVAGIIHKDSICRSMYAPTRDVTKLTAQQAQTVAGRAVASSGEESLAWSYFYFKMV